MLMSVLDADQVKEFNIENKFNSNNNDNQLKQQHNNKKEILIPMTSRKSEVKNFKNHHRSLSPVNFNHGQKSQTARLYEKEEKRKKEGSRRQG